MEPEKKINKFKKLLLNQRFTSLVLFLLVIGAVSTIFSAKIQQNKKFSSEQTNQKNSNVLGSNVKAPQIYISNSNDGYNVGGVIELASTDEPSIQLSGYNISGQAEISLYQANDDALLDYLTHDADGKQIEKAPDESKIHYVTTIKKDIKFGSNSQNLKVLLPLSEKGIWYLKIKINSVTINSFIVRSNIGAIVKEGDNEFIYWGQDFKTKRSVTDGVVISYNLKDGRKELSRVPFNSDGIAKTPLTKDTDVAMVAQGDDRALIPVNLTYLNSSYSYKSFQEKVRKTKYFIFTDRPLYKPGDTVYFKAILRDDDDARYTVPGGSASVKVYDGYYYENSTSNPPPEFESTYGLSAEGTINGQYQIPIDAKVGYRSLIVNIPGQTGSNNYYDGEYSSNSVSFEIEYFKKPEFSIDVATPKTEIIAGDKTSFTIKGEYFSGQPLLNQKVKYTVYSADFYEYQYLADQQNLAQSLSNDYRYGYWYGDNKVTAGTATLDKNGEAIIDLNTSLPFAKGKSQVFSIEATIDDGSLTPSFSRKNLVVYAGEYGIYRKDYSYGSKVNTPLTIPIATTSHSSGAGVKGVNLTAKIHRENWVSYQDSDQKYPSYRKEEEELPSISATTDYLGNTNFTFTPTKTGSYTLTVEGKDSKNNLISKIFYSYVSSEDYAFYNKEGNNDLTIAADKQKYQPTDTARFDVYSYIPNRDIFFSLERGRVSRYQVIHLNGKKGSVEIPLIGSDIPNMYAKASSFDDNSINDIQMDVPVSAESKKLNVKVTPNSTTYGPGETVTVNIETTDTAGNPKAADVALWSVDKAIFELSDTRLGNIFDTFWQERYDNTNQSDSLRGIFALQGGGGGCFGAGTKVLMGDGNLKNIEDVKINDYILTRKSSEDSSLVKAKVTGTHAVDEGGYLIINGNLKVTANHIMWVNKSWKEAGSIQIGDTLINNQNKKVKVASIEWQRDKISVYNLEIENYHTYFANGIWVHNQKGGDRTVFKDTAYWNPSIHTDSSGRAQISFKLPDNLTTWTLAAVASTSDTEVGQITNEIKVTKDIIVRPVLPNILRVGDEIFLSAIVQNFSNSTQTFDLDLKFDAGSVENSKQTNVTLNSNEIKQLYWKVKPTKETGKSKLTFSAKSNTNPKLADVITQEIPVRPFVFEEKSAVTGIGAKNFSIKLDNDNDLKKSTVKLSLAPTIIGTLPTAMGYLINYPYGCVEQTTSRFVPAVIAKVNSDLYATALADKNVDNIIKKSIEKLSTQQQSDGGWTWWFSGESDPFITAYVVEYVLQAKQVGARIDDQILKKAQEYLEREKYYSPKSKQEESYGKDDIIAKNYALSLLGVKNKVKKITNLDNLSPDILSIAVISNYLNGDTNPQTNGLEKLIKMAKSEGDGIFWDTGNKVNFGSKDASTAWAIRAILFAKGDRNIAAKAAIFLTRNRKYDYWSNTYATAQVIRALTELSKTGNEQTPNYTYKINLDGQQIAQGSVNNSEQVIQTINIPVSKIKNNGSNISISKNGDGQIYSTLLINQFHTDKNAPALNHGLEVKREYVNEKGEEYSLAVGDTVKVIITLSGLKANENYGVINDQLPSGLVPINENFKNEQYGQDPISGYYYSYDVTDREVTENGEVLSLYQLASWKHTYSYRARVVNSGTFIVPPATATLMYAPEIYGRSQAQTVTIDTESYIIPGKGISKAVAKYANKNLAIALATILILIGIIVTILNKKGIRIIDLKEKIKNINPLSKPKQDI